MESKFEPLLERQTSVVHGGIRGKQPQGGVSATGCIERAPAVRSVSTVKHLVSECPLKLYFVLWNVARGCGSE